MTTEFAKSSDGTRIAFEMNGTGPAILLVDGAMCHRRFGPAEPFTTALQDDFTVVTYDRRGRGESGDDLDRLIDAGQNGKAVDYFMVKMVGGPFFLPVMFRLMGKLWPQMKAIAPTLRYDARVMGGDFEVPVTEFAKVTVPVLTVWGGKAAPEMSKANAAIAAAIPGAEHRILDGQTHNVSPEALKHEILRFFA